MTGTHVARASMVAIVLFVAAGCTPDPAGRPETRQPRDDEPSYRIAVLADAGDDSSRRLMVAAKLAVDRVNETKMLDRALQLTTKDRSDAASLAAVTDDFEFIGVITIDGRNAISGAKRVIEDSSLPVFELASDLYETAELSGPVFQMSSPHSWEAWRLARYFGPGDRSYRKVGLLRDEGPEAAVAASTLAAALADRGVTLTDTGPVLESGIDAALERLRADAVQAVVAEGSAAFMKAAFSSLSKDHAYQGKAAIPNGWRPHPAGFSSVFRAGHRDPAGFVAAAHYARASTAADSIAPVKAFRESFEKTFRAPALGYEAVAYDAVMALAEAKGRAKEGGRPALLDMLERFDRVRFASLPISFSPTDHVAAERDHLGLWAVTGQAGDPWAILHRTFTSDLERTNILEEDWPSFFEGTTPGGEAPFYYTAKSGIVSRPDDDLH